MKYITTAAITMKINISGLTTAIRIITLAVRNIPYMTIMDMIGTMRSKTIRSFEKRVTIRPIGFESKKMMFARRTRFVIASCKFVLLFNMTLKRATERKMVKITNPPISAPKTIG